MNVYEIAPGLYQSPTPVSPEDRSFVNQDGDPVDINAVVDLEGDIDPIEPRRRLGEVYLYWPIEDKPLMCDEGCLRNLARFVSGLMDDGYQVLVHCRSGLNRASLVTGRTLVARGMDPEVAVKTLRDRRSPDVLNNKVFLEWLLAEEAGT